MKKTYQFESQAGKSGPIRETFMEAWNDMYLYVKALIDAGQMSLQVLETCLWVKFNTPAGAGSYDFYTTRDLAINDGWQQPTA